MVRLSANTIRRRRAASPETAQQQEIRRIATRYITAASARARERGRAEGRRAQEIVERQKRGSGASAVKVKELMNNHIAIRRKYNKDSPRHNTTNVAAYYNNSFSNTNATNIPKNRRVFISKDLVGNKVKQVYNQEGIIKLLMRSKNLVGQSPISRRNFELKHVIPYEEKFIRPKPRSRRS